MRPVDSLYLLIPLSVLAMLGVIGLFAFAVSQGQFDDLEEEGQRSLLDADQASAGPPSEQSKP